MVGGGKNAVSLVFILSSCKNDDTIHTSKVNEGIISSEMAPLVVSNYLV